MSLEDRALAYIVLQSGVEGGLIFDSLMTGQESLKVITKRPNKACMRFG